MKQCFRRSILFFCLGLLVTGLMNALNGYVLMLTILPQKGGFWWWLCALTPGPQAIFTFYPPVLIYTTFLVNTTLETLTSSFEKFAKRLKAAEESVRELIEDGKKLHEILDTVERAMAVPLLVEISLTLTMVTISCYFQFLFFFTLSKYPAILINVLLLSVTFFPLV